MMRLNNYGLSVECSREDRGVGKFNEVDFSFFMVHVGKCKMGGALAPFSILIPTQLRVERLQNAKSTQQHRNQNQPHPADLSRNSNRRTNRTPLHQHLLIITMPPKVRVKIPIHVLVYSLGFFPAAAYGEISIVRIPFGA